MCKKCGYDPYLAGKVVVFEVDFGSHKYIKNDKGFEKYTKIVDIKSLVGRCFSHHKGWVKVRTKAKVYVIKADKVVAYIEE